MTLKSLYNQFSTHPESSWIIVVDNAIKLYNFLRENPRKRVLDLGTGIGCSASVIALALKDSGVKFHIDSIEQFDKCIKIANELIPQELKEYITIHKSKAILWETSKIPYYQFSIYESLPDNEWDFIFNDGPAPWVERENYIEFPNGTIHKMVLENKLKPSTLIAYDGRLASLKILERYFSSNFYFKKVGGGASDFNVLERKDNEVKVRDEKFILMKAMGYFSNMNG